MIALFIARKKGASSELSEILVRRFFACNRRYKVLWLYYKFVYIKNNVHSQAK